MPNVSFDIFFDQDFINITATRGKTAPKAKPEWKVRSAPKLPPKAPAAAQPGSVKPPQRPKINQGRGQIGKPTEKVTEVSDAGSQTGDKARLMATTFILNKVSDALAPTVSGAVGAVGGFAGGAINAVGNGVNGVGNTINRTVKTYGDGVKDYGNSVMDWTSASGVRGATANNPLGLTGTKTAGQRGTTSPSVYHAPKQSPSKTLMTTNKAAPQKRIAAGPAKKAPASASKGPTAVKTNPGALKKPATAKPVQNKASTTTAAGKKTISSASKPAAKAVAKPTPAASKPVQRGNTGATKAGRNPLGLAGA